MLKLAPMRLGGIILAVALSLALSACSALKLGYNTMPDLGYWWLDGYLDFSDAQRVGVRGELAQLHAWHRQQELPQVAELLAHLEQLAPGEITPQQACDVVADVRARLAAVGDRIEPAGAALATTLTAGQLRHLERKFHSGNETFRKEQIDPAPAERQEKRYDRVLQRAEMIYGRLDEPQRAVLRQSLAQSAYDPARILADRERRQQDLLRTLARISTAPSSAADARAQLHAWRERAEHAPDLAYRTWQEGLVQEGCRIFSAVHQSTTPAQRDQAVRRLSAYQRDVRELAGETR
ncbi:DUF6279 family lipoprotein [Ramlibacter sp.]|uniref:DUF6279 family lipoprotein n=1 Tax=Ramlibacter sp. TaxID=1917967 RepID=UPI0026354C78|nr:DUF6279 family lipoprotein [Ramlibacter sp.]MDB5957599.1 hypothetical protein [Ramlibacter sp.]